MGIRKNQYDTGLGSPIPLHIDMPGDHFTTHEGLVHGFYLDTEDLDAPNNMDTLIVVGAKPLHIRFDVEIYGGLCRVHLYRSPVASNNGTERGWAPFNDLNSVDPHPMATKLYSTPTLTSVGTMILVPNGRLVLAPAQGSKGITSSVGGRFERVLRPNTNYLLRVTPNTGVTNVLATVSGSAYEEEV